MNPEPEFPNPELPTAVKGVALEAGDSIEIRRQKHARIILDAMYQFLGLLDVDGTVLEINQAALDGAGICLVDVVGKPFWETRWWALSDDIRARVREMVGQARKGEFVRCDMEVFGDLHGQRTIFVDFSLTPIRDDAGNVVYLLPEGRNITEKIAMEAELNRKNTELQLALERVREIDGYRTKFFANVSHELRTPLALMLGPLDLMLKESDPDGDRQKPRLEMVRRNAHSLLEQVNDLLDLARIDAQQMPLAYVCADVSKLVRELAADFNALAEERAIAFSAEAPGELYADLDRAKFSRVVANLLSNAFKFTPRGGRIHCLLQKLADERLLLSVQDNGPGVPDELKQKIFSRFAQGQEALSASGSGLGLNIVKEFVELHLGTVVVIDATGGGAVFQVELPVRAPQGSYVSEDRSAPRVHAGAGSAATRDDWAQSLVATGAAGAPRILVVEDNPDLRHFLHDVLANDYNVVLAEDGRVALASVLVDPPDLVITDLMMPEIDGEGFIRSLRSHPHLANLPVLVLSARTDDAIRETFLEQLVQDYLTKPFSPLELRARVKNLITMKRTVDLLRRELNSQASDLGELTTELVASRKSLQEGLLALQVSERRWQGLYNNSAVGIALADRDGRILQANPALQRMLGYDARSILGVSFVDITEESQRAMTLSSVHGLLDGTIREYHIQKRYERRDGSLLWANVSASLIPAVDTEGPRLAVIVEDMTSRKEAERALAHTQAELTRVLRFTTMGELVASIAHEVNQPLSAIRIDSQAALRWLERDKPDYLEVSSALSRVSRNAGLAADVIVRVRNFLRKGHLRMEPVAARPLLQSLVRMLHPTLTEARIQLTLDLPSNLRVVDADPIQIQQVLLNLLLNAIEALKEQTTHERRLNVVVSDDPHEGTVFSVRDNGPGVTVQVEELIFDPLYSTKADGLGMGLAISRSIVEAHGGHLRHVRIPEGGANFVFNLPRTSES